MTKNLTLEESIYYRRNHKAIYEDYAGKHIVLHDHEVKGAFDTIGEAAAFAGANFKPGTYAIKEVHDTPDGPPVLIHTPGVTFTGAGL